MARKKAKTERKIPRAGRAPPAALTLRESNVADQGQWQYAIADYEVRRIKGEWGIYIRGYDVRLAAFTPNSYALRARLSEMFDAARHLVTVSSRT